MSAIVGMRCEHRRQPLAVCADGAPRLSWTIDSDRPDVTQRSYRIVVESMAPNGATVWDSGTVVTDRMAGIGYAGDPLASGSRYRWTVTLQLNGDTDPEPATDTFATAPDHQLWGAAEWIGRQRPPTLPVDRRAVAHLTRALPSGQRRTVVHATAGGVYRLWVNGRPVGQGLLAPGWTDYDHRIPFHSYDITDLLESGENLLGVQLADGWYSGFLGPFDKRNLWGEVPVFRALIVSDTDGGEPEVIGTDRQWRAGTGEITGSDLLHGEFVDLRDAVPDWHRTSSASQQWAKASEVEGPTGRLVPAVIDPVRPVATVPAVAVDGTVPGTSIIDLGQNIAGHLRLSAPSTPPGVIVRVRHAEVLNDDGTIYTDNLRSAAATDTYVLDGHARDLAPTFTYHGFRYAEVTGLPAPATAGSFTGVALSSIHELTGDFDCDNELLNAYHSAIVWGLRGNFIETPHDCPSRDERLGWGGDAQAFAPTALRVGDVAGLLDKWTDDLLDAQKSDGCFADIAPGKLLEFAERGSPGYADAAVFVPWYLYESRGDPEILRRAYRPSQRWLEYIRVMNPDYVWRHGRNNDYGDWLALDNTDKALVGTAYWARAATTVGSMAEALGDHAGAAAAAETHRAIAAAFQQEYLAADGGLRSPTQAGCVLALDNDLVTPEQRYHIAGQLVDDIERRGHATSGFMTVARLLPTLTAIGRNDLAHRLLLRDEQPSWGYQIRRGLTTFAERWNPWNDDGIPTEPWMNSFNHFCLGSFGEWMYTHVGGITPTRPGYRSVRIAPRPFAGVHAAHYRFASVSGRIACRWSLDGDLLTVHADVPANVTATVSLPGATIDSRNCGAAASPGSRTATTERTVGSGRHTFRTRIEAPAPNASHPTGRG